MLTKQTTCFHSIRKFSRIIYCFGFSILKGCYNCFKLVNTSFHSGTDDIQNILTENSIRKSCQPDIMQKINKTINVIKN